MARSPTRPQRKLMEGRRRYQTVSAAGPDTHFVTVMYCDIWGAIIESGRHGDVAVARHRDSHIQAHPLPEYLRECIRREEWGGASSPGRGRSQQQQQQRSTWVYSAHTDRSVGTASGASVGIGIHRHATCAGGGVQRAMASGMSHATCNRINPQPTSPQKGMSPCTCRMYGS